jgi:hypothetical protein
MLADGRHAQGLAPATNRWLTPSCAAFRRKDRNVMQLILYQLKYNSLGIIYFAAT